MSVDLFRKRLISSSLLSGEDLRVFLNALPAARRPANATGLARLLVRSGKLTEYQAKQLMQGRTKNLVFGNYVVFDKIGAGGMGVVLKARHQRMDRVVAVKVLPEKMLKSAEAIERFYREVKAAARLSHLNVVTAYDAGEHDGTHYFVMEYVEGQDLAHLAERRGPLPVAEVVGYMLQAAQGLQYAHDRGIVHRDIKPANLLLDASGTVKILDMGLARFEHGLEENEASRLTRSGQVMGTCDYMAPEQAEDTHRADHRADVYSLGCSLYRLVTNKSMYAGETLVQILLAHRDQAIPSLREKRPDVSEGLDSVYQKMVAKRPEDRYQSMNEVIRALESCLHGVPVTAGDVPTASYRAEEKSDSNLKTFLKQFSPGGETIRSQVEMETGGILPPSPPSSRRRKHGQPWWLYGSIGVGVLLAIALGVAFLQSKGTRGQTSDAARAPGDAVGLDQDPSEPDFLQQESKRFAAEAMLEARSEPVGPTDASLARQETAEASPEPKMQPEAPGEAEPAPPGPTPVLQQPPADVTHGDLLEKQRAINARYTAALKPVEEKVAAWDFTAAWQAAERIQFDEPDLRARLEGRCDEIQRMESLKRRIIAKIGEASPPLKKSELKIRGIGGEITDAGPGGITTKTIRGEVERLTWNDLGPQAAGKLMEQVVDSGSGEDCIAAGLLALASGDRPAAERFFDRADAVGADVSAQFTEVAAATLTEAIERISRNEFGKAVSLLDDLETKYVDLPWLVANRETFDAAKAKARQGVRDAEAEALYVEAVKRYEEKALFELRDVVERLKSYAEYRPAVKANGRPTLLDLEQAIADLGDRLIVRLDGKGDFTSIQAAIDAARPNSLIEIDDGGVYHERLIIEKDGLSVVANEHGWAIVTSENVVPKVSSLVSVAARNVSLERLLVIHNMPGTRDPQAIQVDGASCRVRNVLTYLRTGESMSGLAVSSGAKGSEFDSCFFVGQGHVNAPSVIRNTVWVTAGNNVNEIVNATLGNCIFVGEVVDIVGCASSNCTFWGMMGANRSPSEFRDSICLNLSCGVQGCTLTGCNVLEVSGTQRTAGEFLSANPQFVSQKTLDYRLVPGSPGTGQASDGGDIGVRYTPEMMEMCRIALELRAKGVIKF